MRRDHVDLGPASLIAYGHYGRPVLVFPSEQGRAWDFENNGMVGAIADLIDDGRIKLYCVDSGDAQTWSDTSIPVEERARRHDSYEQWIINDVVGWIAADCGGPQEVATLGCSLGAYHAANIALRRADIFPLVVARALLLRQLRPDGLERLGRRRRRDVLPQSDGLRRQSARRSPRLVARATQRAARRGPRGVGGEPDRFIAEYPRVRGAARREGHPPRVGRVGP